MGLRSLAFGRGGDRCRVGKKRRDNAAKQTRFSKGRPMCDGNVLTERRSAVRRIQGGGGEIEWAINEDVGVGQRDSVSPSDKLARIG